MISMSVIMNVSLAMYGELPVWSVLRMELRSARYPQIQDGGKRDTGRLRCAALPRAKKEEDKSGLSISAWEAILMMNHQLQRRRGCRLNFESTHFGWLTELSRAPP
jgi:hypothetical protein